VFRGGVPLKRLLLLLLVTDNICESELKQDSEVPVKTEQLDEVYDMQNNVNCSHGKSLFSIH
jgi:hypothetical protein